MSEVVTADPEPVEQGTVGSLLAIHATERQNQSVEVVTTDDASYAIRVTTMATEETVATRSTIEAAVEKAYAVAADRFGASQPAGVPLELAHLV